MPKPEIGATGQFPDGKLDNSDEGELAFAVGRDSDGNVRIDFGTPVAWMAMPPYIAINLARTMLKHAGAKKIEIEF